MEIHIDVLDELISYSSKIQHTLTVFRKYVPRLLKMYT